MRALLAIRGKTSARLETQPHGRMHDRSPERARMQSVRVVLPALALSLNGDLRRLETLWEE